MTLKITNKILLDTRNPEYGYFRYYAIFTQSRLDNVRMIGFFNRNGFNENYLPEKTKQIPNGAFFAAWKINAKPTASGKLFKDIYKFAVGIINEKIPRSHFGKYYKEKLEEK